MNFLEINNQFDKLKELLIDENTDVSWSNYENVDAILKDLDSLQKAITRKDLDPCKKNVAFISPNRQSTRNFNFKWLGL